MTKGSTIDPKVNAFRNGEEDVVSWFARFFTDPTYETMSQKHQDDLAGGFAAWDGGSYDVAFQASANASHVHVQKSLAGSGNGLNVLLMGTGFGEGFDTAAGFYKVVAELSTKGAADPGVVAEACSEVRVTGGALEKLRKAFDTVVRPDFWKNEAEANADAYSSENLARMKLGKPPIGSDGYPMELHHIVPLERGGTNDVLNLVAKTRTDHRLGVNYRLSHY